MRHVFWVILLTSLCAPVSVGQTLSRRPARPAQPPHEVTPEKAPVASIPLSVPAGTPLKVALSEEVRIQKVGQPVHGKVVEPLYAFDKLVVPAGSEVNGRVAKIEGVSKMKRTIAAMNANFSPPHQVLVDFDELVLADGRHLPLTTIVSPGSGGILQFVPANSKEHSGKKEEAKNLASRKVNEVREGVKQQWESVKKQIDEPEKIHRLERFAVDQLPYHPQYMGRGTSFNADLQRPLDFGTESLKPETLTAIGTPPPSGSVVHALLVTALNSASTKKGEPSGGRHQPTLIRVGALGASSRKPSEGLGRPGAARTEARAQWSASDRVSPSRSSQWDSGKGRSQSRGRRGGQG